MQFRNGKKGRSDQLESGRSNLTRQQQAVLRMRQGLPLDGDDKVLIERGFIDEGIAAVSAIEAAAFHRQVQPLPKPLAASADRLNAIVRGGYGPGARLGNDAIVQALASQMGGGELN